MPKISIITTTYKHEKFIAQAIESVLHQSFTDWELLIGDDNSPDSTFDIVQSFARSDSRIRAWKHQENMGIVGNMNFLLSHITEDSQYITFLEGDDMYTPDNLSEKIKIFEQSSSIGIFYSDWTRIDANSQIHPRSNNQESGIIQYSLHRFLAFGNPIQSFGAVALKKSILMDIFPIMTPDGKKNGMFGPLDYWIWVQLVPNTIVYYSDKQLFQYRIHENNFVRNVAIMNSQVQAIYENLLQQNPQDTFLRTICLFYMKNNSMMSAFFSHNTRGVWKYGLQSFRYNMTTYGGMRIAVMLLSCLPWKLVDMVYAQYKKYA